MHIHTRYASSQFAAEGGATKKDERRFGAPQSVYGKHKCYHVCDGQPQYLTRSRHSFTAGSALIHPRSTTLLGRALAKQYSHARQRKGRISTQSYRDMLGHGRQHRHGHGHGHERTRTRTRARARARTRTRTRTRTFIHREACHICVRVYVCVCLCVCVSVCVCVKERKRKREREREREREKEKERERKRERERERWREDG